MNGFIKKQSVITIATRFERPSLDRAIRLRRDLRRRLDETRRHTTCAVRVCRGLDRPLPAPKHHVERDRRPAFH